MTMDPNRMRRRREQRGRPVMFGIEGITQAEIIDCTGIGDMDFLDAKDVERLYAKGNRLILLGPDGNPLPRR